MTPHDALSISSFACLGAAALALAACGPATTTAQSPSAGDATSAATGTVAPAKTASPEATAKPESTTSGTPAASDKPAPTAAASDSTPPKSDSAPSKGAEPASSALPPVSLAIVEPTKPSGKPPVLSISAPAKNAVLPAAKSSTFEAKVSAKGWTPAKGDHLCVVLDRGSCKPVADASKPIRLSELGSLDEGQHVFSVLARRATGEFYRPDGKSVPFASVSFFVGKKGTPTFKDGSPMLFYTPPEKGQAPSDGVLIDFFVANATVRHGDFIVTASVGGPGIEKGVGLAIEENKPLRLKNARPGEYISRMTLLQYIPDLGASKSTVTVTYTAKPVPGPFGEITRSFFVTK